MTTKTDARLVQTLLSGGVAVLRTDTLYGVVARADDETAVERVYSLRQRDIDKPCIVLLADKNQAYDPLPSGLVRRWPGKVSLVAPAPSAPFWVRRGGSTLAYRVPDDRELRDLLSQTGPLIAPSANRQGGEPAMDVATARRYFGAAVDIYVDEGAVPPGTAPSELWQVDDRGGWERLR